MKKIIQITLIIILLPMISFGQNWGYNSNECFGSGPKYRTKESVKIYEHMDYNSAVEGRIPSSSEVVVTNSFFGSSGWWEICYNGTTGWVRKNSLSDNPTSTQKKSNSLYGGNSCFGSGPTYYAKSSLTIRDHMDYSSAKVGNIPKGSKVIVTNSFFGSSGWWEICYDGTTGWVRKNELSDGYVSSGSTYSNQNTNTRTRETQSTQDISDFDPYMGITTGRVNFRSGPSTSNGIIKALYQGTQLYVFSKQTSNGYYKVIDIETAEIGFVHKNYVRLTEKADVNYNGAFQSTGYSSSYNSDVSIKNQSSYNIKLIVNGTTYSLSPNSTRSVSISPGNHYYIATAPGVIPASGYQDFKSNNGYEWVFYVSTSRY